MRSASVRVAGGGLFSLLARDFAPWEHRGAAFVGRLAGLPAFLAAAADGPDRLRRPSRLAASRPGCRWPSSAASTELIDQGLAEADRQAAENGHTQIAKDMHEVEGAARAAVEEFRRRAERRDPAARRRATARLGCDLFAKKLRHTLASELTPAEVARSRAARLRPRPCRDAPAGARAVERVAARASRARRRRTRRSGGVLDAIARQHPQPDELIEVNRAEIERIEEFCATHDVIAPARRAASDHLDAGVHARLRPRLPAVARAARQGPAQLLLDHAARRRVLAPEATESYLREDNDRMSCCWHPRGRARPLPAGRLRQRSPSLARAVFASGTFAEGWAVYVTQVMMDLGYRDNEPALMLTHWKFYLRAITNAIMDVAIHTEGMTEEQAMDADGRRRLPGAGRGARQVAARAASRSTQLSTYYVGSLEMWDLEVEARRRAARRVGRERRVGACAAHRRRHGRDPRLRLPRPPRSRHLARHAAHQMGRARRCSARPADVDFGLILPSYRAGATTESIDAVDGHGGASWLAFGLHDRPPAGRALRRARRTTTRSSTRSTRSPICGETADAQAGRERRRRAHAQRGRAGQGAGHDRCAVGGRLIVGVGVGWNETEFQHLGYGERFTPARRVSDRGGRDLAPAVGRRHGTVPRPFHSWDEVRFAPLPVQGADLPIWFGGRDENGAAPRRPAGPGLPLVGDRPRPAGRAHSDHQRRGRGGRPAGAADLGTRPRPVRAERRALLHARGHIRSRCSPRSARSRLWAPSTWPSTSPRRIRTSACSSWSASTARSSRRSAMSVSRPASARPRSDGADEHDASRRRRTKSSPPSKAQRIDWATHAGCDVEDAPELGGTLGDPRGARIVRLNYLAVMRWPDERCRVSGSRGWSRA